MINEQEIIKNLEKLKKYFKISSTIEKAQTKYMLRLIHTNNINFYIVAEKYYEIIVSAENSSLLSKSDTFRVFSIKNVENNIIEIAERLSTYHSTICDFKGLFGHMKKLGVKKWMKLNSLKQKLK